MKNILIIGATGQLGSELTMGLRKQYGGNHVVAGYIESMPPTVELLESGPSEIADVTNAEVLAHIVKKYNIDAIFNLAALLSATGERMPQLAWHIQIDGLMSVLEIARQYNCAVFTPSSIGAFGPDTPKVMTPQDTLQRPNTIYGISKVTCELLSDYYHERYNVDTRSVRYPGLISYKTLPGGGTTDYAVDIFYAAVRGEHFVSPIAKGTYMDMMYMPDAIDAAMQLMEADPSKLKHRNGFNVTAMSIAPEDLYAEIKKRIPDFTISYEPDLLRQRIADSWPNSLDDSCARNEWGFSPRYDLTAMVVDMETRLRAKLTAEPLLQVLV